MKTKIPFILFIFILSGLTLQIAAPRAGAEEIWNSTGLSGISDSAFPAIHGMTLVYQARGGLQDSQSGSRDFEIFVCDLATMKVLQITDDDSNDMRPETDGDFVVWQKFEQGSGSRVFLYDIQEGASIMISPDDRDSYAPQIANGKAVWTSQKTAASYEAGEIMLYDAVKSTGPQVISDTTADCSDVRISGNLVVWMQQTVDGTLTQWTYRPDADSPSPEPANHRLIFNRSPASDHGYSVMARRDGDDSEIFLYGSPGGYFRITDNETDDRHPVISQNHAAWISDGAVHVADVAEFMQVAGLHACRIRTRAFTACWKPVFSEGVDEYRLDISTRPDFSMYVPGYCDRSLGNRTAYRVRGLRPDTTYYFRLRAVINGSTTQDSDTATVKTRRGHRRHFPFFWGTGSQHNHSVADNAAEQRMHSIRIFLKRLMESITRWFHSLH